MALVNVYSINLDIKRRMTSVVPTFKQGDAATLKFRVYDDGVLLELTNDMYSEITFTLPNGETLLGYPELVNGELVYDFTGLEMVRPGKIITILSIMRNSTMVSIPPFNCFIFDSMRTETLSYIGILQDLIKETQDLGLNFEDITDSLSEILDLAEGELDELRDAVQTATSDVNIWRVDEQQRVAREQQRDSSETTRVSNEQSRVNAESNRVTKENARTSAENARVQAESSRATTFNNQMQQATSKISEIDVLIDNLESFDYSPSVTYDFPNLITYNGSTYMALKQVRNITPTNDKVNYRLVAQRGVDGLGSVSKVNGVSPDANGNVVIDVGDSEELNIHKNNTSLQKHINIVSSIPNDITNMGVLVKVDGSSPDIPSMITVDEINNRVNNIATIVENELNSIIHFNIKNDGVTDNSAALQEMIDHVHSLGGGVIKLPTGTIKANDVTLKQNVQLVGASKETTVLLSDSPPFLIMESNTVLKNVTVKSTSATYAGYYYGGAALLTGSNQLIESCIFKNLYTGIYNQSASRFTIRDCIFHCDGLYGFYGEVSRNAVIENNVFFCNFTDTRPICFQFASHFCNIRNNEIIGNLKAITGILFMNHYDGYDNATFGNTIIGNRVIGVTEEGISIDMMMQSEQHEVSWTGGTVTSASNNIYSNSLVDSSKQWANGDWYLRYVLITKGKGEGQFRQITSNNATSLTIDKPWTVIPDNTSTYIIGNFAYDNIISHNVVEDCGRQGILLYGTTLRNQIVNNIVNNCGTNTDTTVYEWSNIGVVSCEANEIRRYRPALFNLVADNTISHGKTGIIVCAAPWSGQYTPVMLPSNTIVKGNIIQDIPNGIWVREGTESFIQNNSIRNTAIPIKLDTNTNKIQCLNNLLETPVINQGTNNTID